MSNNQLQTVVPVDIIMQTKEEYGRLVAVHEAVEFNAEKQFVMQILADKPAIFQMVIKNPDRFRSIVLGAAAIGISFNPALAHAYIVPRGNQLCLDVSYRGLVHLAVESGNIKYVKSEIVRANDSFTLNGVGEKPVHCFDPFATNEKRGEIVGVYCVAKTADCDYLVDHMNIEAVRKIQSLSKAKFGPWKDHFEQMTKKTVIKQAAKLWPKADRRLLKAIDVVNEHEGIDFDAEKKMLPVVDLKATEEDFLDLKEMLEKIPDGITRLLTHLTTKFKREIPTLDDMSDAELDYSLRFIQGQ